MDRARSYQPALFYDRSVPGPYDVLFFMPWAAPVLDGSGPSGGAETQIVMVAKGLAWTGYPKAETFADEE